MVTTGAAEVIRHAEFGDQFVGLHNLDLYAPDTGLDWNDITFRDAEAMILS
jgi:CRISPR-associated endonuclease/helicase Cas3